jgi:hypothetical protein
VLFRRRRSLLVLLVALAASTTGAALPVHAADAVVFDGTMTVRFSEARPGYDLAGPALGGADVTLVARLGGADPALQLLAATTGPDGTATFTGVARATAGTPVLLSVEATRTSTIPVGACTLTELRYGSSDGVVAEPTLALDIVGFLSTSTVCPPGGPVPAGIEPDGTVVVTVVGAGSGIPLAAAEVTLTATSDDGPFQSFAGATDDDGRVTFAGVGRPAGATAVTFVAAVAHATSSLADGCTVSDQWSGSEQAPGAAGTVQIVLAAGLSSTITCPPPGPDAPVLGGAIIDASGAAVTVGTAWLTMTRSDGARWVDRIEPGVDGSFAVRLQRWGSEDDPAALEIHVLGVPTGTRTIGDCVHTDGEVGSLSLDVALAEGFDPDPVTVVTATGELHSVCGVVATPAPGADPEPAVGSAPSGGPLVGPSITLPPTDAAASIGRPGHAPLLPALVVALVALAPLVGWALIRRDA